MTDIIVSQTYTFTGASTAPCTFITELDLLPCSPTCDNFMFDHSTQTLSINALNSAEAVINFNFVIKDALSTTTKSKTYSIEAISCSIETLSIIWLETNEEIRDMNGERKTFDPNSFGTDVNVEFIDDLINPLCDY